MKSLTKYSKFLEITLLKLKVIVFLLTNQVQTRNKPLIHLNHASNFSITSINAHMPAICDCAENISPTHSTDFSLMLREIFCLFYI